MNRTSDPEKTSGPGSTPTRRWVYPSVLTAVVVAAVAGLAWTAYPGAEVKDVPTAAGQPTATVPAAAAQKPTAKPVTPGKSVTPTKPRTPLDNTHANASLRTFLAAAATIDSAPEVNDQLSTIASGAILEEIANEHVELDSNGWTQHGTSVIDAVKVLSNTGATATVQACVDSSAVEILDTAGDPIGKPGTHRRALNIYTLTHTDDAWQVTNRTFPDDPTC